MHSRITAHKDKPYHTSSLTSPNLQQANLAYSIFMLHYRVVLVTRRVRLLRDFDMDVFKQGHDPYLIQEDERLKNLDRKTGEHENGWRRTAERRKKKNRDK
ncbi:hypothetical protein NEOLEDRAFT_257112 [Neolentinus lepideus HHB14362 ss-1]|uniref:Uncharacterized protein n=1 Tax=Neolentinus lepideus HHB14362 ss-1 TaxID=1314782 RepID=A0A165TB24_9AGAM|nr:hypothetical protein NEOLEDRAFT_257112 [Neolentinus lepideus HHB14362 ss-1]